MRRKIIKLMKLPCRQALESPAQLCIHKDCHDDDSRRKCYSAALSPSLLVYSSLSLSSNVETIEENQSSISQQHSQPMGQESTLVCIQRLT